MPARVEHRTRKNQLGEEVLWTQWVTEDGRRAYFMNGEVVRVELRTDWISRSSFGMSYRLTEVKSGRLVADAKTVAVTFDYETETSMPVPDETSLATIMSAPLPDEIRQHFVEIEGRELPGKPR